MRAWAEPAPLAFHDVDTVPLILVAAPGHRLLGRPNLAPEDLSGERLLVNVPNCSFHMAADRITGPGPEGVRVWRGPRMPASRRTSRTAPAMPRRRTRLSRSQPRRGPHHDDLVQPKGRVETVPGRVIDAAPSALPGRRGGAVVRDARKHSRWARTCLAGDAIRSRSSP